MNPPPGPRRYAVVFVLFSGARLGGALAFPLLAWLLARWPWRGSFLILGCVGIGWALFWFLWFRDYPEGRTSGREADAEASVSLVGIFRSRGMALAMTQSWMLCCHCCWERLRSG